MKKYFLIFLMWLGASVSAYATQELTSLEGNYNCQGTELATNEPYTCAMVVKKTGQTYLLKSQCNDGSSYTGTGIYDHQRRNLSLVFINPKKPQETGVVLAEVKKDYSLTSTWTYLNKTSVGHGACQKR